MTTDNSRYEEAAKEYAATFFQMSTGPGYRSTVKDFIAGASFAEKQGWNAAIDKAMSLIMEKNHDYPIHHVYEELDKLKI